MVGKDVPEWVVGRVAGAAVGVAGWRSRGGGTERREGGPGGTLYGLTRCRRRGLAHRVGGRVNARISKRRKGRPALRCSLASAAVIRDLPCPEPGALISAAGTVAFNKVAIVGLILV